MDDGLMEFRVLLKKNGAYTSIYKVSRNRAGSSISMWISKKTWMSEFDETYSRSDLHFTYPSDGNIHYSIKHYDSVNGNRFETIYYNEIIIKHISSNNKRKIEHLNREQAEGPPYFFIPKRRPPPLEDYANTNIGYAFPTLSSSVIEHKSWLSDGVDFKNIVPKNNYIIIDLDVIQDCEFNIFCRLLGFGSIENNWEAVSGFDEVYLRRNNQCYPHIELVVGIKFKK